MTVKVNDLILRATVPVEFSENSMGHTVLFGGRRLNARLGALVERYRLDLAHMQVLIDVFDEIAITRAARFALQKGGYRLNAKAEGWVYRREEKMSGQDVHKRLRALDRESFRVGRDMAAVVATRFYSLEIAGVVLHKPDDQGDETNLYRILDQFRFHVVDGAQIDLDTNLAKVLMRGREMLPLHRKLISERRFVDAICMVFQRTLRQWLQFAVETHLADFDVDGHINHTIKEDLDMQYPANVHTLVGETGRYAVVEHKGLWYGPYLSPTWAQAVFDQWRENVSIHGDLNEKRDQWVAIGWPAELISPRERDND